MCPLLEHSCGSTLTAQTALWRRGTALATCSRGWGTASGFRELKTKYTGQTTEGWEDHRWAGSADRQLDQLLTGDAIRRTGVCYYGDAIRRPVVDVRSMVKSTLLLGWMRAAMVMLMRDWMWRDFSIMHGTGSWVHMNSTDAIYRTVGDVRSIVQSVQAPSCNT